MRPTALALLLVAALGLLGGCLQGGEQLSPDDEALQPTGAEANETSNDGNATERAGEDETDTRTNETHREPDEARGTQNHTGDEAELDEEPPTLPGNLSMEDGEVLERSPEQVAFRWEGQAGPTSEGALGTRTVFDVPAGIPLHVNATLTWSEASDLTLAVDGEHVDAYCSSTTATDPGVEGGSEACQVRTLARSGWDEWGVRVDGQELDNDAPPRPVDFTVEVRIATAPPWTGPPSDPTARADGGEPDPGWPGLDEAKIRPGVKVGAGGADTNRGTGNFVFSSPDNRTLYLGWIAHGVDGMEPGDTIELPTVDVEATLVYCSWGAIEETVTCPDLAIPPGGDESDAETHPRFFNDFALLQLPAESRSLVHPAVPVWGGPTGMEGPPSQGTQVLAVGNTPFRDGGRSGVDVLDPMRGAVSGSTERSTQANVAPQPLPGDSGSPVLTADGRALGTISAIGPPGLAGSLSDPEPDASSGSTVVPNLQNALALMENETALDVELETWPTFATPRAEDLADPPVSP